MSRLREIIRQKEADLREAREEIKNLRAEVARLSRECEHRSDDLLRRIAILADSINERG
jgi:predicted nuclease with TOPRIM domain